MSDNCARQRSLIRRDLVANLLGLFLNLLALFVWIVDSSCMSFQLS